MSERDLESLVGDVAESARARHYGKHRGLVRDVDDPDELGRIKAEVPSVYHEAVSPWALPAVPFAGPDHGLVLLPEVGDGVWIEFEAGDISRPIWSGFWWADGQRPSPKGERIRLLATRSGHQVVLDEENDRIQLVHPGGAEVTIGSDDIVLTLGTSELKITATEIVLNHGMIKVTTAGVSLLNDAMKFGV